LVDKEGVVFAKGFAMPANAEIFGKYRNRVFVETGSYVGDGIRAALAAGFEVVHSIELAPKYFAMCQRKFKDDPRVILHFGDSTSVLPGILEGLKEPATFWLDGHWSCDDTALGAKATPLMEELEAIGRHPIKTHTILIDDMRCWKREDPIIGFSAEDVRERVLRVNEKYRVWVEDSARFEKDILVASV
jgi:hypothetical protein